MRSRNSVIVVLCAVLAPIFVRAYAATGPTPGSQETVQRSAVDY